MLNCRSIRLGVAGNESPLEPESSELEPEWVQHLAHRNPHVDLETQVGPSQSKKSACLTQAPEELHTSTASHVPAEQSPPYLCSTPMTLP